MRVDGSSSEKNAEVIARIQDYSKNRPVKQGAAKTAPAGSPRPEGTSTIEGEEGSRANGALGLLDEGHFKGVAALRLSINFAEEIQAANGVKTNEALQSGISGLQDELNGALDDFIVNNDLSEEERAALESARDTFNSAVDGLLGAEDPAIAIGGSDVFGELRTAFQDFLNSLIPPQEESDGESIIPVSAPEGEETVEGETEVGGTTTVGIETSEGESGSAEISDIFSGLRDTLSGIFESTISGLEETVAAINQPVIPEPEGNGRAYEKFLAAYNEIYGSGGSSESTPAEEGLNAVT